MAKSSKPKIVAAMPAYNEERYIGTLVLQAKQFVDQVIVIDDGSTDNTSEIARLAGAILYRNTTREGKGAAIQKILTEIRKTMPDVLVLLDADSQHNPHEIPNIIKPILGGSDLVIGSREAQADKTPFYRRIGQKILLRSVSTISKQKLTDSESGFRALSSKAISEIHLTENGFAVESEMLAKATEKGLKIAEVPISNIYTRDGSTLHPVVHGLEVLIRIMAMISERRPLFFFGAGGGIMTLLGLIAGGRVLQVFSSASVIPMGTALVSVTLLIIGIFSIFTGIILRMLAGKRD